MSNKLQILFMKLVIISLTIILAHVTRNVTADTAGLLVKLDKTTDEFFDEFHKLGNK